jgi:hypothetical protein
MDTEQLPAGKPFGVRGIQLNPLRDLAPARRVRGRLPQRLEEK